MFRIISGTHEIVMLQRARGHVFELHWHDSGSLPQFKDYRSKLTEIIFVTEYSGAAVKAALLCQNNRTNLYFSPESNQNLYAPQNLI